MVGLAKIGQDFMGEISGVKSVRTADIPSDTNKAYQMRLDDDGGIRPSQGIFADPVEVAHAETLTEDSAVAGKPLKPLIVVGVGILILFIVLKVSK